MKPLRSSDTLIRDAVLVHLILLFPVHLNETELIREVARDPDDGREQDAIRRAVRDLSRVGLLHRLGSFVFPTRAALCAYELWQE